MRLFLTTAAAICTIVLTAFVSSCTSQADATRPGPNGGDVVSIQNGGGPTKAEVINNADTGEVMIHTWDSALRNPQPIDAQPMTLGSGANSVELDPHPLASDPPGQCSRFYGQAEWMRGGSIKNGWLRCCGGQGNRQEFAWTNCWTGGRTHGGMWAEFGEHRRGMQGAMGRTMGGHQ